MTDSDDIILWRRLKAGDEKSLDAIFDRYVRLLYNYGYRFTPDAGLVQDCIQELFVRLWTHRMTLSDTNNVKFYLTKSLRRSIVRKLNKENKYIDHQGLSEDYDFEIVFSHEIELINEQISKEQKQKLSEALELLSKRQREIIYHKYYHNLTYNEIAEVMGLNINSVYNLMSKAMEMLTFYVKTSSFTPSPFRT